MIFLMVFNRLLAMDMYGNQSYDYRDFFDSSTYNSYENVMFRSKFHPYDNYDGFQARKSRY
jgi:hypothetical protein